MSTDVLREVGKTGRPHGVRGDIYVDLITDRTERLAVGARLRAADRWLIVSAARSTGTRWLVHFDGVPDRTAAEKLVNLPLLAEPLPEMHADDALYVHDLIGADVVDAHGTSFGKCVSVLANPAHDILELDNGALVPVVFIVSSADGRVVIAPPDGLFDLDA